MRVVRFVEREMEEYGDLFASRWGILIDNAIYPLLSAPWERQRDGVYLPLVDGSAEPLPLKAARLLAPVQPSKILCVGRNYAEHAAELGNDVPAEPLIFLKPLSSLLDPDGAVVYPSLSQRVDHEGEIAIVMGKRARFVSEEDALSYVFGYTVANDVTARDLQKGDGQWTRGKGFDTFCPVGPWVDSSFDPANRRVIARVNGEVRQDGNTDLMIFSLAHIISYLSQFCTLEPGDLILTGTPAGVGPVHVGDTMVVEVEGLGSISNLVISEEEYRSRLRHGATQVVDNAL